MFVEELRKSLTQVLKKLKSSFSDEIQFEHPAILEHGDYSTNIALMIRSKPKLKAQNFLIENPRVLAEKIVKTWQEMGLPDFVEKVEVAGPGFLNIWLNIGALGKQITSVLNEGDSFGKSELVKEKTMVIDYSSPNIAKPFGIGHLRSTNIGQALYNLYSFVGWKTIGDNHLGDWGTQFGKIIFQIVHHLKNYPELVEGSLPRVKSDSLDSLTIEDLEKLYVEFHKEAETKPEMEDEAREWFKKLEKGDKEAREIWQACVDISLKEFNRIYKLLGVKIDYTYGESFYEDKMTEVLQDCREKGILKESEGAQVVEIPGMQLPAMLVKSDGATTYFLRDLTAIKYRVKEWHPDLIVYEVGADQTLHFTQLFNIATQLGYGDLSTFVHIAHGLIRWPTGKFSTRKGDTIHLEEVLNEAIERAREMIKSAGVAKELALEEQEKVAQAVGIGGIKYNDLKQNPRTDIVFDWEQILTLSGNSGPYLQYTYARAKSVLRKSTANRLQTTASFSNLSPEEIVLLRTLYRFPGVVAEAAKDFSPNLVCNFLYDLSQKFNLFYDKNRIIGSENESFRLGLTSAVGQILKNGLQILGIEVLERM